MEFTNLSRYLPVKNGRQLPFRELRKREPVRLTQDLQLSEDPENIAYAESLARQGIEVVPIRRMPPLRNFLTEWISRGEYFLK